MSLEDRMIGFDQSCVTSPNRCGQYMEIILQTQLIRLDVAFIFRIRSYVLSAERSW